MADRDDDRTATLATDGELVDAARYLRPAAVPAPGDVVGRYRIVATLGRGGEGVVLAAHDPLLDRPVALKLLRPERRAQRDRLLREGQAIARLRHPNVVTVHDVGAHGDDLFIAMELVRGSNLRAWLRAAPRGWREAAAVVAAAGRGLAAAHAAGLVHGDFKPENVLVADDGHVVVGDFGLARSSEAAALGAPPEDSGGVTGTVAGTPAYLAPEQWAGRPSTHLSDQFAFGVTLHEALFGCRPFERPGADPAFAALAEAVKTGRRVALPPHRVPRRIVAALDRALALAPAARHPTLAPLLAALAPRRRAWRIPTITAAIAGGAVLAIALARDARRADPRVAGCDRAAAQLDAVWHDAARTALRRQHAGAPWLATHLRWLDDFAQEWRTTRRGVCLGQLPLADTHQDAAAACVDRALRPFAAAVATPGPSWPELPALRDCLAPPTLRPQSRSLAFGPQGYPILSPDGRDVAINDFTSEPYIVTLDAPVRPRSVTGAREVLAWQADGAMYLGRPDRRCELVRPDGDVRTLGMTPTFVPRGSQLSPDARWVTFEAPHRLEIRDVASGAVIGEIAGEPMMAAWEPDGRRLALSLASGDVAIFDITTRRTTILAVAPGVGPIALRAVLWLHPGELALSGELRGGERRVGVWSLAVDDAGELQRAPSLRLIPEPATAFMPGDRRGARLALKVYALKQRTFAWHRGQARELRSTLDHADVVAVDPARGKVLSRRDAELLVFETDGSATPRTILATAGVYAFRAGKITTARATGPARWALVEVALDGATTQVAEVTWDATDVTLACDQASADHCVLVGQRGGLMVVAPLHGTRRGPEVALPGLRGGVAVAADGRRWVTVRDRDSAVVEVDAATGRERVVHQVFARDCYTFGAGWRAGAPGIWAKFACADRFGLVHGPIDGAYPTILDSDGWMSGVVAYGDDRYLYSVQDNDAHLQIVDGL